MAQVLPLPVPQSALLPYRIKNDKISILLITSSGRDRWIIPKGNLEPGMPPEESAAMEAFEEAGAVAKPTSTLIGYWYYEKRGVKFRVAVFPGQVDELLDTWPEMVERERQWFSIEKAMPQVNDSSLRRLIKHLPAYLETGVPASHR